MQLPSFLQLRPVQDVTPTPAQTTAQAPTRAPCDHQWRERLRSYAPPQRNITPSADHPSELLAILSLGVTEILDDCLLCHFVRTTRVLGSPDPQLDELMDKALRFGAQYIQRENATFVIQQYFPPQQQGGIALR